MVGQEAGRLRVQLSGVDLKTKGTHVDPDTFDSFESFEIPNALDHERSPGRCV